jgi:hypothetical protein
MTRLCALLPLLLVTAGIAAPTAGADDPPLSDRYVGSFGFAGGEREANTLQSTLQRLLDDFNPLLRPIARRRFKHTVRVPERIEIAVHEAGLSLDVVGAPGFPSTPHFEGGVLVLRERSFEGTRDTHFLLSDDGGILTMRVATTSRLLPDRLDYELTFARDLGTAESQPDSPSPPHG